MHDFADGSRAAKVQSLHWHNRDQPVKPEPGARPGPWPSESRWQKIMIAVAALALTGRLATCAELESVAHGRAAFTVMASKVDCACLSLCPDFHFAGDHDLCDLDAAESRRS